MEDSKSTKKHGLLDNFFDRHQWLQFFIVVLLVSLFSGSLYYLWFKFICGYPVHEERIVFTIQSGTTITDPRLPPIIYNPIMSDPVIAQSALLINKQNEDQIETLRTLIKTIEKKMKKLKQKYLIVNI